MTEFHSEITRRAHHAVSSLHQAQESGDDYLVAIHQAELEGLARLAAEHGLRIPQLQDYNAA
jgi:hypothetical protein